MERAHRLDRDSEQLVDKIVGWVKRARLETPFAFMLESHLPLARLMGHGLYVFEPIAAGLMGFERVETIRKVLFDPEALEKLRANLAEVDKDDADPPNH
jgi:hypothetical protein